MSARSGSSAWFPVLVSATLLALMLLLCLLLAFGASRQPASLPVQVQLLDDPAVMSPQQAMMAPAERWQPLNNPATPLGYGRGQLWFAVALQAKAGYVLQLDAAFLDQVDFYLLRPSGEMVQQVLTGDQRTFASRLLPVQYYLLPVDASWQSEQLRLYIRTYNVGQSLLPLQYLPQAAALEQAARLQVLQSFFLGLMLFAALMTALTAIVTRQYHLVLFSGLLLSIALVQGEMVGFFFQWLWPAAPWLNQLTEWAVPLAVWCCAGFVRRYFMLNQPLWRLPLQALQGLALGLLLLQLLLTILPDDNWRALGKQAALYLMQVCVVASLLAGCWMLRRQTQRALLFLLPMGVLLSSVVLATLQVLGLWADNGFWRLMFELGSTMAGVLMSCNLLVSLYLENARQSRNQQLLLERQQQLTLLQQKELARSRIAPYYQLGSYLALTELLNNELARQRQQYRLLLIEFEQFDRVEVVLGRPQLVEVVSAYVDSLLVLCQRYGNAIVSLGDARHQVIFALSPSRLALLVQQDRFVAVLGSIRKLLHQKFTVAGLTPDLNPRYASVLIEQQYGQDAEVLLAHAALALTYVNGTAGHVAYQLQFSAQHRHRLTVLAALAHATNRGEFSLVYQPVQALDDTNACVAVEAFIRWQHPQLGAVSPAVFIPLAEEAGLISTITAWVYKEVRRSQNQLAERGIVVPVSMNLSGLDLQNPALLAEILRHEHKYPITQRIQFELAETVLTPDLASVQQSLQLLAQAGSYLLMDDFGAGESMLTKLGSLPLSALKVDMTLLTMLDSQREQLLAATIRFGKTLGMQVICEGVETRQQLEFLTIHGADAAQGYLIARPMPLPALLRWLGAAPADVSSSKTAASATTASPTVAKAGSAKPVVAMSVSESSKV